MLDHADRHLARLIAFLETAGIRDNTLVWCVGQWRQPGGRPLGFVNAMGPYNFRPEPMPEKLRRIEDIGGPDSHTIFRRAGDGVQYAVAPLQAEYPWRRHPRSLRVVVAEARRSQGELRHQFVHASDLVPTLLDLIDVTRPPRSRAAR